MNKLKKGNTGSKSKSRKSSGGQNSPGASSSGNTNSANADNASPNSANKDKVRASFGQEVLFFFCRSRRIVTHLNNSFNLGLYQYDLV